MFVGDEEREKKKRKREEKEKEKERKRGKRKEREREEVLPASSLLFPAIIRILYICIYVIPNKTI